MRKIIEKYNDTKARYISALIMQNRYNKNRGMTYTKAIKENTRLKGNIDFWLEYYCRKAAETGSPMPEINRLFNDDTDKKEKSL